MKVILLTFILLTPAYADTACVILLHGLARSESSMEKLAQRLQDEGFVPVNLGYPSRKFSIEKLADKAITPALKKCPADSDINFVTHSLGGILVRQYLSKNEIPRLKRVVMLGPPNKGSEVVDKLGNVPGFHFVNGDAGLQLGTGELSVPNNLGEANFDVGIIAGTKSINLILSLMIPKKDDGKVSIENTKLEGMNDHLEMPVSHPFLMKDDEVIEQVVYYLQRGKFNRDDDK